MATEDPYLADCLPRICEWDYLADNQRQGQLLEALHVLHRHPDSYREMLNKDPEDAMRRYHKVLEEVKRIL